MFNSKKSLLSAISLLAILSMMSQPVFSTSTDDEKGTTSTPPKQSISQMPQEELAQGKTASQNLQEFKEGLPVGAALSTVKEAFQRFQENFEAGVNAPRTFSGLEDMQQFMTSVQSARQVIQTFATKLSEYDDLGVEKLTEKSKDVLESLLPKDLDFLTGSVVQQTTLVPEDLQAELVSTSPSKSAVVEEEKETYASLMATPQGRLKLRNEALALVEADMGKGQVAPKASTKLGGFLSGLESGAGMGAAIANLKQMIGRDDWDNEYNWPMRGWVKKHNIELIRLVKEKLEGPVKQKYS